MNDSRADLAVLPPDATDPELVAALVGIAQICLEIAESTASAYGELEIEQRKVDA